MTRNRRLIILLTGGLAAVTCALSVPWVIQRVQEERWIGQLSSSEDSLRTAAASRLGAMRSARAVPRLLDLLPRNISPRELEEHYVTKSLLLIGTPAIGPILDLVRGKSDES